MIRTAEALAKATDETERKSLEARYDRLHELLHHHDAFNLDHRIEQVLDGLGFGRADYHRPVETFSGGQQSRLMLAKLLLSAPDVMLLDEPNNHLDIAATRWLEDYLVKQHEAMLIVSHDRWFLDRVVTKIFEMHAHRVTSYPGNFQQYWRLRQERYDAELKAYESAEGVHREAGRVHPSGALWPTAQASGVAPKSRSTKSKDWNGRRWWNRRGCTSARCGVRATWCWRWRI